MACCGKGVGVVNATPTSDFVSMTYLGSNSGVIRFEGYLKRSYRVNRGTVIDVHPDDVKKLEATGKFIHTPVQNTAVVSEPEPEPLAKSVELDDIDATDGATELATEHGIDLSTVQGSGANGRIVLRDIKALISD